MKRGMNTVGEVFLKDIFTSKLFRMVFQKHVFIGLFLYGMSSILWMVALSRGELSYLYPLIGAGYIITSLLAWFFFKENLTWIRFLGIFLISSGVFLVVLK
jgi:drug/metabolite transporter (DMT)-like permease